jgi:sterol 14-demethylase
LISDVKIRLDLLADDPSGITDPFESVYRIVYQLTMRMVGCDDIAEKPELLEKTLKLYETVESSATPAVYLPNSPSSTVRQMLTRSFRLFSFHGFHRWQ